MYELCDLVSIISFFTLYSRSLQSPLVRRRKSPNLRLPPAPHRLPPRPGQRDSAPPRSDYIRRLRKLPPPNPCFPAHLEPDLHASSTYFFPSSFATPLPICYFCRGIFVFHPAQVHALCHGGTSVNTYKTLGDQIRIVAAVIPPTSGEATIKPYVIVKS